MGEAIGPHGPGSMHADVCKEYKRETGREVIEDFPYWEPCHKILLGNAIMGWENIGGDIDEVNGIRVPIAGWPIKWQGGDGSLVRLVAIVDKGDQRSLCPVWLLV
jgi:kynurenine formamidase